MKILLDNKYNKHEKSDCLGEDAHPKLDESDKDTFILYRGKGMNNNSTNKYSGGRFYADNLDDASNYGSLIQVVELNPNAKLFSYSNSYDYCDDNGLLDKEYDIIYKLTNQFHTLRDAYEELVWNGENPNLYYQVSQYIISQELSNQGYDGAEWKYEDDLIPHQYQIWNDKVVRLIKNVDENGNELKEHMNKVNEEFVNELVPGELYHFIHNNNILYGTFKRKTPAWLFFDVEGKEVLAKPWTSVATTTEELEELLGLVNKMEKDTKIPSQVPNRFTRVPNQHGKPMGESNELEKRADKHKKKSKGMGWHMSMNAGDVEKGIEVFNNSTSCNSCGEGTAMGESMENKTFIYEGPIYYRGHKIAESSSLYTTAPSYNVAVRNILYQAANGDKELYNYDIVDNLVKEVPTKNTNKSNKIERERCYKCGYELNDMGDCPVCDYGEDDLLESLSDLEALWQLNNLD